MRTIGFVTLAGLLATATTAALAQDDFYQSALDRLEARPGRVQPAKAYFYSGDEKAGCPAITPACRRAAYLRAGDVVLVGKTKGNLVFASFTAGGARMTEGWLQRSAVVPMSNPVQPLSAWSGQWQRDDEANVAVKPGKRRGSLSFTGDAMYGSHDPDRVKRGAVNVGEFAEQGAPKDGSVTLGSAGQYECRIKMRLIGPYLAVADNNNCGGNNVSFSGVYRKTSGARR